MQLSENINTAVEYTPIYTNTQCINDPVANFKVAIIGPSGVGKTTFIRKIKYGENTTDHVKTIGSDVYRVIFNTNIGYIGVDFWDLGGCEELNETPQNHIYGSDAILFFTIWDDVVQDERAYWSKVARENYNDNKDAECFSVITKVYDETGISPCCVMINREMSVYDLKKKVMTNVLRSLMKNDELEIFE